MFLIGYALALGANDFQIGLLSTIPMLCVIVQLLAAVFVERGVSRRALTVWSALGNVSGWALIILIPYATAGASRDVKLGLLVGVVALVTLFAYISGNARGSWVGDLIPENFRGTFFGRIMMFAGIIGTLFALIEGRVLDHIQHAGIGAFSLLFTFGILIGLVNTLLFLPQADVTLARKTTARGEFLGYVRETFRNKPFMVVMLYALLWSLQSIAGPFYTTYQLRDLHMSFLGIGIVGAMGTLTLLLSSPFWGRIVDRYGCRPVLVVCSFALAPFPLSWLLIHNAHDVYTIIAPINLLGGFLSAGISVALSTLIYKVTPSIGRSVQFAVYSIIVTLAAAPMPALGGLLPGWAHTLWPGADLRVTFYASIPCILAAAITACYICEQGCRKTGELLQHFVRIRSVEREVVMVGGTAEG
jgi:MFS family permease